MEQVAAAWGLGLVGVVGWSDGASREAVDRWLVKNLIDEELFGL